jgi:acyl carrier protein
MSEVTSVHGREPEAMRTRVHGVVARLAPTPVAGVSAQDRLVEDLGFDSMAVLELGLALEAEFGLPVIGIEHAVDLSTVADLEQLISTLSPEGR